MCLEEAIIPKFLKEWTFDTEIKSMVWLHLQPDKHTGGTVFLLCEDRYFVFSRKNTHSDYDLSEGKEYAKIIGSMPMTVCMGLKQSKVNK